MRDKVEGQYSASWGAVLVGLHLFHLFLGVALVELGSLPKMKF